MLNAEERHNQKVASFIHRLRDDMRNEKIDFEDYKPAMLRDAVGENVFEQFRQQVNDMEGRMEYRPLLLDYEPAILDAIYTVPVDDHKKVVLFLAREFEEGDQDLECCVIDGEETIPIGSTVSDDPDIRKELEDLCLDLVKGYDAARVRSSRERVIEDYIFRSDHDLFMRDMNEQMDIPF